MFSGICGPVLVTEISTLSTSFHGVAATTMRAVHVAVARGVADEVVQHALDQRDVELALEIVRTVDLERRRRVLSSAALTSSTDSSTGLTLRADHHRLDRGVLEPRDVDEVRDEARHPAQRADRRAQRVVLILVELSAPLEVLEVGQRDREAVVEVVREQRARLGAVGHPAIRGFLREPDLDERALRAHRRGEPALELGDAGRLDDEVVGAGLERSSRAGPRRRGRSSR